MWVSVTTGCWRILRQDRTLSPTLELPLGLECPDLPRHQRFHQTTPPRRLTVAAQSRRRSIASFVLPQIPCGSFVESPVCVNSIQPITKPPRRGFGSIKERTPRPQPIHEGSADNSFPLILYHPIPSYTFRVPLIKNFFF